ncbi:MAG: hypothetical protein K940chlam2_00838 [Chlamydiae bacterium]|nr:hypothetical protein [Chlamydiota bacterium]
MSINTKDLYLFKHQRVKVEDVQDQEQFRTALVRRPRSFKILNLMGASRATLALANMKELFKPLSEMSSQEREALLYNLEATVRSVDATPVEREALTQMIQKLRLYNPLDKAIEDLRNNPDFIRGFETFIKQLEGNPPFFVIRAMQTVLVEFGDEIIRIGPDNITNFRTEIEKAFATLEQPTDQESGSLQSIVKRLKTRVVMAELDLRLGQGDFSEKSLREMIELLPALNMKQRISFLGKLALELEPGQLTIVKNLIHGILSEEDPEEVELLIKRMDPSGALRDHMDKEWGEGEERLQNFRQFLTDLLLVPEEVRQAALLEIAEPFNALPKEYQIILINLIKSEFGAAGLKPLNVINALRKVNFDEPERPEKGPRDPARITQKTRVSLLLGSQNLIPTGLSGAAIDKFIHIITGKPAGFVAEVMGDFAKDFEYNLEKLGKEEVEILAQKMRGAFDSLENPKGHEEVFNRILAHLEMYALVHKTGAEFFDGLKNFLLTLATLPSEEREKLLASLVRRRQHEILQLTFKNLEELKGSVEADVIGELFDLLVARRYL